MAFCSSFYLSSKLIVIAQLWTTSSIIDHILGNVGMREIDWLIETIPQEPSRNKETNCQWTLE